MRTLVIIPTYNERENIASMIEKVLSLEGGYDLLVIDDGSPDGTAEIVRNYRTRHPERLHLIERSGKLGLGTAYLAGFRWGLEHGYEALCEMDCDFSHDPDDLCRLVHALEQGADVAVGSRYVKGGKIVNWPLSRLAISYFGSLYVRMVTWMPVHDTTAGFVCYRREALERINFDAVRMKGYGFQIEMKYTAWRLGLRIAELPITFTERREGSSKMSGGIFQEALWGVLKLRFRHIRPRQ
ncbi:MAG: polyprenol monophosphomannose synthase [Alistipes sp.]|nr:polyprenol monophosphomannose synthase [Alistipes sp.]